MNEPEQDWTEGVRAPDAAGLCGRGLDPARAHDRVLDLLGGGQRDAGFDGSQRPKSQLAILPGTTHHDLIHSPMLTEVATAFLVQ